MPQGRKRKPKALTMGPRVGLARANRTSGSVTCALCHGADGARLLPPLACSFASCNKEDYLWCGFQVVELRMDDEFQAILPLLVEWKEAPEPNLSANEHVP
jgi:hypothetical protein